ncbi:MAG: GTPase-associated system all-helical protein GASH [Janthinobacterium lividum]
MAKVEAMDPEFARWMREFEIEPDAKAVASRWSSLQTAIHHPPTTQTECWVRLSFDTKRVKPTEQAREQFAQTFKKGDPTFEPRHAHQLEALAGMALALCLKREGGHANEAALAILCASLSGARTESGKLNLVERAKEHLEREIWREGRDIAVAAHFKEGIADIDVASIVGKLSEGVDVNTVSEALKEVVMSVQARLNRLQTINSKAAEAADRALSRQDQEIGMHWWLTGGRSSHLKTSFAGMDDRTRPLILAKELSDLTRDRLGPASVDALLIGAGVNAARERTIPEVVTACDLSLLEWLGEDGPSPMTTPIHFAIHRQQEVGLGDEWVAPWSKITEIGAEYAISELDLALQFYRENRLLNLADD